MMRTRIAAASLGIGTRISHEQILLPFTSPELFDISFHSIIVGAEGVSHYREGRRWCF